MEEFRRYVAFKLLLDGDDISSGHFLNSISHVWIDLFLYKTKLKQTSLLSISDHRGKAMSQIHMIKF